MAKKKPKKSTKKPASKKKELRPTFWRKKEQVIPIGLLLVWTIIVFAPSFTSDFVYWDDDFNVFINPLVTEFSSTTFIENTIKIFSIENTVIGNYNPLSIWTFGIENMIFGLKPSVFHFNNIILHLGCVFLVYRICLMLGLKMLGSIIVASLFAIHPMRVESVSWITERKDVLYGIFYLGSIFQYLKYRKDKKSSRWIWIHLLAILSGLSKIQAVTLPVVLVLIDYFKEGKFTFASIFKKWMLFVISLTIGIIGIIALKEQESLSITAGQYEGIERLFIGSYALCTYIIKSIIPYEMSPLYPYPEGMSILYKTTILIFPIFAYAVFTLWKKERKVWVFGLLFFLTNVILMLQIVGAGQGYLADRFTYIAYFGIFFIIGYYLDKNLLPKIQNRTVKMAAIGLPLLLYSGMTLNQTLVWKNSETLWSHVIKHYEKTDVPYQNRGNYYRDKDQHHKALADYSMSLKINPRHHQSYNSRAKLFFEIGKSPDTLNMALADYNQAIQIDPNNGEYKINNGAALAKLGRLNEAITMLNEGLKLKPDQLTGYINRSIILRQQGRFEEALQDYRTYISYNTYNSDIWYEKGNIEAAMKQFETAIASIDKAIEINPDKGIYHYRRAESLANIGRLEEAKYSLSQAEGLGYTNINPALKQALKR